jgi:fructose-1,6-bisphosphatase/inositol monophosphatase family enzyme
MDPWDIAALVPVIRAGGVTTDWHGLSRNVDHRRRHAGTACRRP